MPPQDVQARLTLLGFMFKECMKGVTGAIQAAGVPPLKPEEKEVLFAECEKAVWRFPDHWFQQDFRDEQLWAEEMCNKDEVRTALENAISVALAGRRPGAPRREA
ncbi:MAG TPA: hypothetical protein VNZ52_11020 [Candidatus Thermoplasmatota archaeon]|nr:hypothetical protein [Candidatus Thermoplasmatota archaeon]